MGPYNWGATLLGSSAGLRAECARSVRKFIEFLVARSQKALMSPCARGRLKAPFVNARAAAPLSTKISTEPVDKRDPKDNAMETAAKSPNSSGERVTDLPCSIQ